MACTCGIESKQKCKELFEAVLVKEYSDIQYGHVHRLTVDSYALQHPPYTESIKSFAAHLTGMCCTMEYGNDRELLKLLRKWLDGKVQLEKPPLLTDVGSLTIAHVAAAKDGKEHAKLVEEWAKDVWNSYAVYHTLAKDWIERARRELQGR